MSRVLSIFWIQVLHQICDLKVASLSFSFFSVSFKEKKYLIWIKSSSTMFYFRACFVVVSQKFTCGWGAELMLATCDIITSTSSWIDDKWRKKGGSMTTQERPIWMFPLLLQNVFIWEEAPEIRKPGMLTNCKKCWGEKWGRREGSFQANWTLFPPCSY